MDSLTTVPETASKCWRKETPISCFVKYSGIYRYFTPVRVLKVNLAWVAHSLQTTPTFTTNGVFSLLMPPQQETEKSVSKKTPKIKQANKKRRRFFSSVTEKEIHEDKKAGDLY